MRLLWEDRAWDDYLHWQTQSNISVTHSSAMGIAIRET